VGYLLARSLRILLAVGQPVAGASAMIETFKRIDDHTMSVVREFAQQHGCSDEVALKFLLKIGNYPQGADEGDEAYAARLDALPDPDVKVYRGLQAANDL
jgi:hypothetical protein